MKRHAIFLILILISVFALFSVASATNVSSSGEETNLSSNQSLADYSNTSAADDELSSISNSSNSSLSNISTNGSSALNGSNSTDYRKNLVFVRFKSNNSSNASLEEISKNINLQIGATVLEEFKEVSGLQLVEIPENMSLQDAIAKYMQNPNVLYAEPNYIYKEDTIPNDNYYNSQWGLSKINAPAAWNITTGSSKVIIAVVDSGIDLLNPDLKANIWINPGEIPGNGIDDDHNGYIDDVYGWNFVAGNNNVTDDNGHGTHVSGIIAAVGNNLMGVTGVMWNATIMPIKFLDQNGDGYIEDAVSAIRYATKMGASIISCSWGGEEYSKALKDVIDASSALVVCAAGNDPFGGDNNDMLPIYPASFTSKNIIAVAATNQNDNLAYFSNYGLNSVDVAAPGVNIYSTLPGSKYGYESGTSMATPYVSGLAGLIKSLRPDLNSLQIKYTIMNNVDYLSSLTGKVLTSGRINAFKALTNIITDSTAPTVKANLKSGLYYHSSLTISLTASEAGNIYYTLNGMIPTKNSLLYTSPITIHTTKTLRFMAIDTSGTLSSVYTKKYLLYKLVKYSYKVKVPYKKWYKRWYEKWYKKWHKKWYKKWYKYQEKWYYYWTYRWKKWKHKWKYKWHYKWHYKSKTRHGQKYVLIV